MGDSKRHGDLIIYHIQTNESLELSMKSKWDVYSNIVEACKYWQGLVEEYRRQNHARRWNELRIYLKTVKPEGYELTLHIMEVLDGEPDDFRKDYCYGKENMG